VHLAARVVDASAQKGRTLDGEIARAFRAAKGLDDAARAELLAVVDRAIKRRALYARALSLLPFDARKEGVVLCALVDGAHASPLPTEDVRALREALARARELDDDARAALESPAPAWLRARLSSSMGEARAREIVRAFGRAAPLTLRANSQKGTRAALAERLLHDGIASRPCARAPHGLVVDERVPVRRTRAFQEGLFEVQDEGSQLVAIAAGARPGAVVVDACAGAGGKTLALADDMENTGTLYAFDTHAGRLSSLRERARRADVHNIRVHALDDAGRRAQKRLAGSCDVVLVDAPCSGSGTLRRAPDLGAKLDERDVARLTHTQDAILDACAPLVAPGGRLVYATCSLLDDENGARAARFLSAHADFVAAPLAGGFFDDRTSFTLAPDVDETDGFFVAAFERRR